MGYVLVDMWWGMGEGVHLQAHAKVFLLSEGLATGQIRIAKSTLKNYEAK